jgi:hypothetical protein
MMKRLVYPLLAVLMVACSSVDCPVNSTVATLYQIRNSDGTELKLIDTMTVMTVDAESKDVILYNGRDSIIYNKGVGTCKFNLPISHTHPEDELVFHFIGEKVHIVDTLWIAKEDYPHFESVDCNTGYFHKLTAIRHTHNCLDSVVIVNPSVTNDDQVVHVHIYPKISN